MCMKSSKNCYTHSSVGGSSTSYSIADGVHGSINQVPSFGWKSGTFSGQLAGVNSRPVGLTNRGWLPIGIVDYPISGQASSADAVFTRRTDPNNAGGIYPELLFKGMMTETNLIPNKFLVEKKGEGQRPVVRGLNQFVKVEYFKMEGLYLLLQARDWMIKLDLKDAYLQVPIHPEHQKYLVFQWNSKWYQFTCLPFGLSAASRAFTKLSSRLFEADGMLSNNLSGPHLDPSPGQRPVTSDHTISMSAVGVSGAVSKQQEIIVDIMSAAGVLGILAVFPDSEDVCPSGENKKDPAGCHQIFSSGSSAAKRGSQVCGESSGAGSIYSSITPQTLRFAMNSVLTDTPIQQGDMGKQVDVLSFKNQALCYKSNLLIYCHSMY